MVDFHVGLHRDLPVAFQLERVARRQPHPIQREFVELAQQIAEPFGQRHGVGIEVHEDEIAQPLAPDRLQRAARRVEAGTEILPFGNARKAAVGLVGPVVVGADQPGRAAALFGDHRRAAMPADVVKGAHFPIVPVDEHDGLPCVVPGRRAPRFGKLVNMAGEQPAFPEHAIAFKRVEARVRIASRLYVGQVGEARRRGGARAFPLHRAFQEIHGVGVHRHRSGPPARTVLRVMRRAVDCAF